MNDNNNRYLFHTDYFHRPWTWIRRAAMIIVGGLAIIIWNVHDETHVFKPILWILFALCLIVKRKDDVAISMEYFFHFRRSVIPRLGKIDKYKLKDLISIRCGGIHSDGWELIEFFNGRGNTGGYSNQIEMTFKDGSSKSLDLSISRDNLDRIVRIAYDRKKQIELAGNQ